MKQLCILTANTIIAFAAMARAATTDWPQFRGPRFDNNFPNQQLPATFGPGTNEVWKLPVHAGHGSPCIVGDKIFLTAFDGKNSLETLALNRRDGSLAWSATARAEKLEPYFVKLGSPATATCASDGQQVLSYFGSYGLVCYDLAGKELWHVPLPLPQTPDGFGSGGSPIIHAGMVYLLRDEDGPGQGLYAYNIQTGKKVWHQKRDGFHVSFGSPVIWDNCVVAVGDLRVKGYDLKTGAERWVVRGTAAYPCTTPTPGPDGNLYVATWSNGASNERNMPEWKDFLASMDKNKDGKLTMEDAEGTFLADFFSTFDKNKNGQIDPEEWQKSLDTLSKGKNVVLALRPGGKGDVTTSHVVWSNEKGAPYVASPLFVDRRLYLIKDGGMLTVYDGASGKLLMDKERLGAPGDYYASPIAVGNTVLIASANGVITTIAGGDTPTALQKVDLGEPIFATPVMVENTLYVRSSSHLWAFGTVPLSR